MEVSVIFVLRDNHLTRVNSLFRNLVHLHIPLKVAILQVVHTHVFGPVTHHDVHTVGAQHLIYLIKQNFGVGARLVTTKNRVKHTLVQNAIN